MRNTAHNVANSVTRPLILAATLVFLAACSEQQITTEPASPTESGPTSEQRSAGVGDTITLHGSDSGLMMDVTLIEVIDPAKAERFFGPGKNKRLVAVRLRVENVGSLPYSDSPSNGAVLIDTADQGYDASILDSSAGPALGSPKIAPGDARVGLITFEVSKGTKVASFQLTLDSGFGPETGQWEL